MKRTIKRAIIALDLQHVDVPGVVSFTRSIGKGLTGNTNLTAADIAKLPVAIADLLAAATTLESTRTARATAPSKAATRLESEQGSLLMEYLTNTATFIEGLANTKAAGDFTVAAAIITSVGFQLKKPSVRRTKGFTADSPAKTTAHLHVPPAVNNAVRLVQYSADSGKTYSLPIVVHGVDLFITGLKSGIDYLFQTAMSTPPAKKAKQTVTAGSEQLPWGDAVSCVIS